MERLDQILASRLALVVAPAGYGKTTVMAQWARRAAVDIAWYRVDTCDDNGHVLVRHLAAAVQEGTGVPVPATDGASLIHALETRESPMVLVVDDLHLGGPAAERLLYELLLAAPPHLYVLVGSRRLPGYNLARSELAGFVVTGEELKFRAEEVEALFGEVYDAPLAADDADLLARRTGGWAAALHIFHLTVSEADAAGRRRAVRTGGARYARDYLCLEVLEGLPEDLITFARRTSVFEVLTAARCDALLDRRGSQRLLEDLERWQAMTTSRDGGLTFRCHDLLRSHLQSELTDELGAADLGRWRREAASILEHEGALDEALRAHTRNEDWEGVRRLVRQHGDSVTEAARRSWLSALPASLVASEPALVLARARVAVDEGRFGDAAATAGRVADAEPSSTVEAARVLAASAGLWGGADDARALVLPWVGLLRDALRGNPADVAESARRLHDPWGSVVAGLALMLAGDVAAAGRGLSAAAAVAETPRLSCVARLGAAALGDDGGQQARQVAADAAAEELPWLSRLARELAEAQEDVRSGGDLRPGTVAPLSDEPGDTWGAALAQALRCAAQVRLGRPDATSLEVLAAQLRALDAPVLEAWARAGLAYVSAVEGLPDARREALSAEAFARAAAVPGALALAYGALGRCAGPQGEEMFVLADASADDVGLTFRPWRGRESLDTAAVAPQPAVAAEPAVVAEPSPLVLRCFGRFDIRVEGKAPDLSRVRPRARALLRLLAVEAGRPMHRELITDALWRDLDRDAATHNLHVSVSSLRRALEPGVPRGASRLLVRDGERYVLKLPAGSSCDLRSFDRALAGADLARAAGQVDEAVASLSHALELYTGEVLPEDGPEEWVLGPREHYRARAAEAALSVAETHLARHDPAAAAAAALQSIDIDACRDGSWRVLVSAYQAAGDLAAAEQARRSYADVLASLGVVTDTASAVLPKQRR